MVTAVRADLEIFGKCFCRKLRVANSYMKLFLKFQTFFSGKNENRARLENLASKKQDRCVLRKHAIETITYELSVLVHRFKDDPRL